LTITGEHVKSGVVSADPSIRVGLLTGGSDRPYVLGLSDALASRGIHLDVVGSDELVDDSLNRPEINFLNLRGDQSTDVDLLTKAVRISKYYGSLFLYAARAKSRVFHILWNNKFELVDRILLMLWYRALGKRVVLTAHNVNTRKRDGRDTWLNRTSLRIQYRLCHHVFVHNDRMKSELAAEFGVPDHAISVIPFGINDTIPKTNLTRSEARRQFGLADGEKTALFFGQIAPYKGLEYLIAAMGILAATNTRIRLIVAGKVKKGFEDYWNGILRTIDESGLRDRVITQIQFIPDEEVEPYFKASDVVILPYAEIFQSGVPFLAYAFGLPVIATDVGPMREDVIEGRTGFLCQPRDPDALARTIQRYFSSDLYRQLDTERDAIRRVATEQHSWMTVSTITEKVYRDLLCPN
jgi:D-inositol-3-phosphate glycosyltransferase